MGREAAGFYKIENTGIKLVNSGEIQTTSDKKFLNSIDDATLQNISDMYIFKQPYNMCHISYEFMGIDDDYPNWDLSNNLGEPRIRLWVVMGDQEQDNDDGVHNNYLIGFRQNSQLYSPGIYGDSLMRRRELTYSRHISVKVDSWWDNTREEGYRVNMVIYNPIFPLSIFANYNAVLGMPYNDDTIAARRIGKKSTLHFAMNGQNPAVSYTITNNYYNRLHSVCENTKMYYESLAYFKQTGYSSFTSRIFAQSYDGTAIYDQTDLDSVNYGFFLGALYPGSALESN